MNAQERFSLEGKTALVTGASHGIGRGIAIALAQHGADVAIVDMATQQQSQPVLDAIRALGRQAWFFRQDLAQTSELSGLGQSVWEEAGPVDVLVNNAGIRLLTHYNQISIEQWRKVMATNCDAVFFLSRAIAERMIAAGIKGRIINTSSVNGMVAEAGLADYNASKGAVELITRSLAIELGAHGITVNTICPGMIETEIAEDYALSEGFEDYFLQHIPLGHRFGTVEDCVGAVVFLASPAGGYITGQSIVIDGGILCEQVPRLQFMEPYRMTKGK
ncbi:MAG: gluconate 5-dehydrogenase [Planctomycetaceae bacterium]|nr:gluconate 5-dehydrogenase [Planctomycetaceae bacterium]